MTDQEEYLIIKADEGDFLTTVCGFFLIPVFLFFWINIFGFTIEKTSIVWHELIQPEWVYLFSLLLGYILHEFCQHNVNKLFGGRPRKNSRKRKENRTHLDRKYLFSIAIRSWSQGTKFSLLQYFFIVLSPIFMTFLCLPAIVFLWQNSFSASVILLIGLFNSILIPFDILVVAKLIGSGKFEYYVVDKPDGTYLAKR